MWNKFEKIAQANLDHYNDHPSQHTALAAMVLVGGFAAIVVAARKVAKKDHLSYINN